VALAYASRFRFCFGRAVSRHVTAQSSPFTTPRAVGASSARLHRVLLFNGPLCPGWAPALVCRQVCKMCTPQFWAPAGVLMESALSGVSSPSRASSVFLGLPISALPPRRPLTPLCGRSLVFGKIPSTFVRLRLIICGSRGVTFTVL
jgi:hypothetical protein